MQTTQPVLTGSGIAGAGAQYMAELWSDFYPSDIRRLGAGKFHEDDFTNMGSIIQNVTSTNLTGYGAFTSNNSTTLATAVKGANIQGGGLLLQTSADDNAEACIVGGGNVSFPYAFVTAIEDDTWPYTHMARVRYETRFRVSSVTNNDIAFFAGLTNSAAQTGFLTTDASALLATGAFIGFRTLQASASTLQFVYQAASQTVQNVMTVATIEANKWYKVGFDYNPLAKPAERIAAWYNDTKQSTYVTATNMAAATFPASTDSAQVLMNVGFGAKNGSAVTGGAQAIFSHVRVAQEYLVAMGNEATGG